MKPFQTYIGVRLAFVLLISVLSFASSASAQTGSNTEMKAKAIELIKAQKYTEALPYFEKLAQVTPDDAEVQYYLGFALFGQAKNTENKEAAKGLRARARAAFVKAKNAGMDTPTVQGLIDSIPLDGGEDTGFSKNAEADKFMEKGEAAFSTGRLNDALAAYQSALKLDPKLYHAALFSGDVYMQQGKYSEAEIWYQKAIAIDPNIETAYRYSATPLMKEGKTAEARDRYIEAFIVDPYNRLAVGGLVQWGEATQTPLSHPKIDVPEFKVGADGKANTTINVNPAADDGSVAWIGYSATRSEWYEKKFKQNYPNETAYRHSLKEEAEALRSVIAVVKETAAKTKTLNPQLAMLVKLDQEGFLESYILLAMPDKGIAQDHAAYLKQNRDRLRQYVAKYVIGGK